MKNRLLATVSGFSILVMAGCDAPARQAQTTADGRTAAVPHGPAAVRPSAFGGYRRYRGTVGNLPVTLEMTISPTASGDSVRCQGSYFYERKGGLLWVFAPQAQSVKAGLELTETLSASDDDGSRPAIAHWRTSQPLGPVLSGTWTSATGRRLPFLLREDYAGAVRYERLTETLDGGTCQTSPDDGSQTHTLHVMREYLHLLGPDTLQPGLRALQCPPPSPRRAQLREELQDCGCDAEKYGTGTDIEVMYNGNGLLSLLQTESENLGGAYPSNENEAITYDLTTGKTCDVRNWLHPSNARAVAALLDHYLRADSIGQGYASDISRSATLATLRLSDLPDFGLNSEGLYCTLGNLGAPHVVQRLPITIPYVALRPYVLPGTPLARLLRARGLQPMPK